ncbi:hypothetical protein JOF55_001031 [Haloactinomyces albus]|uniref:Uncharacterized protein n=1 Tax=Haloactinomyces albus TaxID=1352928 RepID=A0AAE4CK67_9ACTN|nr:hypothetical protein [Haloactinomyces albus]
MSWTCRPWSSSTSTSRVRTARSSSPRPVLPRVPRFEPVSVRQPPHSPTWPYPSGFFAQRFPERLNRGLPSNVSQPPGGGTATLPTCYASDSRRYLRTGRGPSRRPGFRCLGPESPRDVRKLRCALLVPRHGYLRACAKPLLASDAVAIEPVRIVPGDADRPVEIGTVQVGWRWRHTRVVAGSAVTGRLRRFGWWLGCGGWRKRSRLARRRPARRWRCRRWSPRRRFPPVTRSAQHFSSAWCPLLNRRW